MELQETFDVFGNQFFCINLSKKIITSGLFYLKECYSKEYELNFRK